MSDARGEPQADSRGDASGARAEHAAPHIPLSEALRFWLQLGFISFGGPAGQIALMHRELVERRRWISESRFLHALNYCMLLPGPEAQQLATYLGWLMHRTWGGIAAGALFVLPSLFILIALSWLYMAFGNVAWVAGVFEGIKPAVAAIVVQALWRLGGRTLRDPRRAPLPWLVALSSFVAIAVMQVPFPAVVLAAALVGWAASRWAPGQFAAGGHAGGKAAAAHAPCVIDDHTPTPAHARFSAWRLTRVLLVGAALWALPMAALVAWQGAQGTATQMGWFFSKAALVTFGGAYAVLPYVMQAAVGQFGWLSAAQMIDGLALGETTPGPLIMVVAFVGFVGGWNQALLGPDALWLGGALAAAVVTWFTFLPSFVFILAGGPLVESTHGRLGVTAPLAAVSAAVVGVIGSLALFLIAHTLYGTPTGAGLGLQTGVGAGAPLTSPNLVALGLGLVAGWALIRRGWGVIPIILGCGAVGAVLRLAGWG